MCIMRLSKLSNAWRDMVRLVLLVFVVGLLVLTMSIAAPLGRYSRKVRVRGCVRVGV